jgi:hypothetical protein
MICRTIWLPLQNTSGRADCGKLGAINQPGVQRKLAEALIKICGVDGHENLHREWTMRLYNVDRAVQTSRRKSSHPFTVAGFDLTTHNSAGGDVTTRTRRLDIQSSHHRYIQSKPNTFKLKQFV